MRNIFVPIVSFVDADGKTRSVREITDLESYTTIVNLKNLKGNMPDEIVTRRDYAGENAEDLTYRLIEANIVELFDNGLDFSKINPVRIPTFT